MNSTLERGAFVLSIDTELAWGGLHSLAYRTRQGLYEGARDTIGRLLELLDHYEISATWAVVGHLFLRQCRVKDGVKHPEVVRPTYDWFAGDWFDADPCTDLESDPIWYGPDIVQRILGCKALQEIGCHGFSHMIVGDPGCSRECFDSELKACVEQADRLNLNMTSFVFPRNSVGHLGILAENGFNSFRGPAPAWFARFPGLAGRLARLIDSLLPLPPPVTVPRWDGTIWELPASYFYPHRDSWAKLIPPSLAVRKSKLGLAKAVRETSVFHLWFHPFNLATDPDVLLQGLETIFAQVHKLKNAGELNNPTMGDLTASLQPARQIA